MRTWIDELFLDNPMMQERRLMARKLYGGSQNRFATWLAILVVLGFLAVIAFYWPISMPPQVVIYLQTVILCILQPGITAGLFAAEREKRTWEMLRVVPLSTAQMIAGKISGPILTLLGILGVMLVPAIAGVIGRLREESAGGISYPEISFGGWLNGQAISVCFGLLLTMIGLWCSARATRVFAALMTAYGFAAFFLIAYPILIGLAAGPSSSGALLVLHPFYAMTLAMTNSYTNEPREVVNFARAVTPFLYLLGCAGLLYASHRTLKSGQETDAPVSRQTHA